MYFDGVVRHDGAGAGVVFSLEKHVLTYSFMLTQLCSNSMAEYQPLILGLQMAIEMGIKDLDIYGDSQLVIKQLLEEYEVKKDDLMSHHKYALRLHDKLETIKLHHVPRSANKMANVLANFAATLALGAEESMNVPVCNRWVVVPLVEELEEEVNAVSTQEVEEEDWR